MAHSSGGGSSFFGTSFSGTSLYRRSKNYFPGAKRYRYSYRGRTEYFYANEGQDGLPPLVVLLFAVIVIIAIFLGPSIKACLYKIKVDYDDKLVVEDDLGRIKDKSALLDSFSEFKEKTGITPALITVSYKDYAYYYDNLEDYAYALYSSMFTDEKHWLIVYEELGDVDNIPEDIRYKAINEPQWQFCGMQGDETDYILTYEITDSFNSVFCGKLSEGQSPDQAYVAAMNSILPSLRKFKFTSETAVAIILIVLFTIISCSFMNITPRQRAMRNALEDSDDISDNMVQEEKNQVVCSFCHNSYPADYYSVCPNCGTAFLNEPSLDEIPEVIEFHPSDKK